MPSIKRIKVKNPCKICLETVNDKTGVQCRGACKKWMHFKCLRYTPGKILDIKKGYVQVKCPCPNCETSRKGNSSNCSPYNCGKPQCSAKPKTSPCPEKSPIPHSVPSCLIDCDSGIDVLSITSLRKTNIACVQEKKPSHLPSTKNVSAESKSNESDYKQARKDSSESKQVTDEKTSRRRHTDVQLRSTDYKHVKKYKPKHNHSRILLKEVLTEAEKDISPGGRTQFEKTNYAGRKKSLERKPCEKNERNVLPIAKPKSTIGVLTEYTVTATTSTCSKPGQIHQSNFKYVSENSQTINHTKHSDKKHPETRSQSTYVTNSKKRKHKLVRTRDTHTCPSAKFTTSLFVSPQDSLTSLEITDSSESNLDLQKDLIQTDSLYKQTLKNRRILHQKAEQFKHSPKCQKSFEINNYKRCKSDSCLIGSFSGPGNPLFNAVDQFNDMMGQCRELMGKMVNYFKGNL